MRGVRLICCASILVTIGVVNAASQQAPTSQAETGLPEYVLEVTRPEGCLVEPISPKGKAGALVYAFPRATRVPRDNSGHPITSKVFVAAKQDGEQWDVKVTIGTGEFYDAGDFKVGEFKLNPNQRTSVPGVAQFGLSPIRVGVLKIVRGPAGKPSFENLTQSISLETMDVGNLPDPFKLTLKNNSAQDLVAIQYNTFGPRGFLGLKWLSPGLLTPLVKVGETYKLEVNSEDNSCGGDEGYSPNQTYRIELVSAVFADGTYEGQTGLPVLIKGTALGNRKNLERVVGTMNYITDPGELAQLMNQLQEGMGEDAEPYLVERMRAMFPTLAADANDGFISFIRSGMHEVKMNLMRDALTLQRVSQRNLPELSTKWVGMIKTKYERWWTAAEKMTSQ